MALTKFPIPSPATSTAIATATADATATALAQGDLATLLIDILTELKIITIFLQQGLNVQDDPSVYRNNPDNHL